jgi:hypothetical protein
VAAEVRRVSKLSGHSIRTSAQDPLLSKGAKTSLTLEEWKGVLGTGVVDTSVFESGGLMHDYNSGVIKMNMGCGVNLCRSGWMNADVNDYTTLAKSELYRFQNGDIRGIWATKPDSATAIVLMDVLQELTYREASDFLRQSWAVLMAGGAMRLSVTDPGKVADLAASGRIHHLMPASMKKATKEQVDAFFFQGKSRWTKELLLDGLVSTSFCKISTVSPFEGQVDSIRKSIVTSSPETSVVVDCRKLTL